MNSMKLIAEIDNNDIGETNSLDAKFVIRKAVRAVILNDKGEIGITYSPLTKLYKLPGGGIELEENYETALKREIREEAGYESEIDMKNPVGMTIEYRENDPNEDKQDSENDLTISYVYYAKVIGEQKQLQMTEKELKRRTEFKWMKPESILQELQSTQFKNPVQRFICLREIRILEEVINSML